MTAKNEKSVILTLLENKTSVSLFGKGFSQLFTFAINIILKGEIISAVLRATLRSATNLFIKGEVISATGRLLGKVSTSLVFGKQTLVTTFRAAEKWSQDFIFGKYTISGVLRALLRVGDATLTYGKYILSAILDVGLVYKLYEYDPLSLSSLDDWTIGGLGTRLGGIHYLYDQFTTDVPAGSLNGTSATPTGGTRNVTDTNNKIYTSGGSLVFDSGEAANDGLWYTSLGRWLGKTFLATISTNNLLSNFSFGWDSNSSGTINDCINISGSSENLRINGSLPVTVGTFSVGAKNYAITMRKTGMFFFEKISTYWNMLYVSESGTNDGVPSIITESTTSSFSSDNLRVPNSPFIPVPLVSDGFSATITDGLGNEEGNGVVGSTWSNTIGTWQVSGGKCLPLTLSSGSAIRTIVPSSSNVLCVVKIALSGDRAGICVKYVDSSNYVVAYITSTNCYLDKVVAGSTTNISNSPITYSSGKNLIVIENAGVYGVYYNDIQVGTISTISDFSTNATVGLYSTNLLNSFDDFVVWGRGTSGEYYQLDIM